MRAHCERLYPPAEAAETARRLLRLVESFEVTTTPRPDDSAALFDERDVVLITYADQIAEAGRPPLRSLHEFLDQHLAGVVNTVHLLPFYPWTSDDGFAVVDYDSVDPALGEWSDVAALGSQFGLMVDAVFNHVSAASDWFQRWLRDDPAVAGFFIAVDPDTDLSAVTRPRSAPLLTPVQAAEGIRHVWTTFGPDQVDLNYANPEVLVAVTETLLGYVARGARIIRLDAVAFLWKQAGTSSIHLPQTHEIVRLWRALLDAAAPGTLLITETNVPHAENVAYFGDGHDEAHLVYQFPMAPLVLSAFHLADATTLREWAAGLGTPSRQTTFFNFLGSHDGVGLRPAEGLLTPAEIAQLCALSRAHGGGVSSRATPEGALVPYELNTVYFDALTEVDSAEPQERQVARFVAAQSILLALAGVPGIYVHALLGSRNWHEGMRQSGQLRTINRQKFDRRSLESELATPGTLRHEVFTRLRARIAARTAEPAFHPNGGQRILDGDPAVFALERRAPDESSRVLCLHNLAGRGRVYETAWAARSDQLVDLCSARRVAVDGRRVRVELGPYEVVWLRDPVPA